MSGRLRQAVVAGAAVALGGCSSGGAAADRPEMVDAAKAQDATTSIVDAGDEPVVFGGYEGSIPYDACAATGTCPVQPTVTLAAGQASPAGITVDATRVYWVNLGLEPPSVSDGGWSGSQIMACAKDGCDGGPAVLASGSWSGASKLGVDDANVYWIVSNAVLACPLSGCTGEPQVLWAGTGPLYDIAVDSTGVYFTSPGAGRVMRCPSEGCDGGGVIWPSDAGSFGEPSAIALDSTTAYFVDDFASSVEACEKSDCAATLRTVATPTDNNVLAQLAIDDANVYVTDLAQGRVLWAPKDGTTQSLSVLVRNLVHPVGLATDGVGVYYTDTGSEDGGQGGSGRVAGCVVGGCAGSGTAIAGFVNEPLDVAVDGTRVYWTDFGSSTDSTESDAGRVRAWTKP